MPVLATRDQELVRAFRALFELTHDELARVTGISVSTWERVERGETERARASRGIRGALETIEEIMTYLDRIPYGDLRRWAARGAASRRSPIDLVHRVGGVGQLLQQLRAQGDGVS